MFEDFEEEKDLVEFFDIQNLYFDHPLSVDEEEELKTVLLGFSSLSQIYFKGDIDIVSIEKIKDLLLMSSTIEDSKIEKIITSDFTEDEYRYLVNANYKNPNTWSISYNKDGNNYMIDTIPNVREFNSYIDRIKLLVRKERLTPLEIVFRLYDIIKLFELDESINDDSLSLIVRTNKSSSDGYNKLFSFLLSKLSIPNYLGIIKSGNKDNNLITMVDIEDKKYDIHGFFLFNPAFDTLDKKLYKDNVRMINYNYFGVKLSDIEYSKYKDTLTSALGILSINKFEYAIDRLSNMKDISLNKEFNKIFTTFGKDFKTIYDEVHNESYIDESVISNLCDNVYGNTIRDDYSYIVVNNYLERKKELFKETTRDKFNKMLDKKS